MAVDRIVKLTLWLLPIRLLTPRQFQMPRPVVTDGAHTTVESLVKHDAFRVNLNV